MPHSIVPSEDGTYITLTEIGDMTREVAMEHTVEAHALGRELGIRCYLVDVTQSKNVEPPLTNYRIAYRDMQEMPDIDREACVAVLVDPDDRSHDFYETLANTAGLDLTLFRDRHLAIEHLRAGAERLRRAEGGSANSA